MGFPHPIHPRETPVLSRHFGEAEARSYAGWVKRGGYRALEKALGMTREQAVAKVVHAEPFQRCAIGPADS